MPNTLTFTDEVKMLFKELIISFSPNEIKEAYEIIYKIDREISTERGGNIAWRKVRISIEEYLILRQKTVIKQIREGSMSPRQFVHNMIYNICSAEIDVRSSDSNSNVGSIKRSYVNLRKHVM